MGADIPAAVVGTDIPAAEVDDNHHRNSVAAHMNPGLYMVDMGAGSQAAL